MVLLRCVSPISLTPSISPSLLVSRSLPFPPSLLVPNRPVFSSHFLCFPLPSSSFLSITLWVPASSLLSISSSPPMPFFPSLIVYLPSFSYLHLPPPTPCSIVLCSPLQLVSLLFLYPSLSISSSFPSPTHLVPPSHSILISLFPPSLFILLFPSFLFFPGYAFLFLTESSLLTLLYFSSSVSSLLSYIPTLSSPL